MAMAWDIEFEALLKNVPPLQREPLRHYCHLATLPLVYAELKKTGAHVGLRCYFESSRFEQACKAGSKKTHNT